MTSKPIIVVTVRGGLVEDVHSTSPVTVYVEDWDCPPDRPLLMDFECVELTPGQARRVAERQAPINPSELINDQPERNPLMNDQPTNGRRAQLAKDALAVFTASTLSGDHPDTMDRGDLECSIGDLISDLLHYARQQEFDVGGILQQACGHFALELLDEEIKP